jgi:hypothetical protein
MNIGSYDVDGEKMKFVDSNPIGKYAGTVGNIPETDAKLAKWFRIVCLAAFVSLLAGIVVTIGVAIAGFFTIAYWGPAIWYSLLIAYVYIAATQRNVVMIQVYGIIVLILQILVAVSIIMNLVNSFDWFQLKMTGQVIVLIITFYISFLLSIVVWILMTISAIWALNIHKEMAGGAYTPILGGNGEAEKASYDAV